MGGMIVRVLLSVNLTHSDYAKRTSRPAGPLPERVYDPVSGGDKCVPEIVQLPDLLTIPGARTDA